MDQVPEYLALISNRENLYRFLGRLYKLEIDQPFLDHITGMKFPGNADDEELTAGYSMMAEYLRQLGPDPLADLAVDFARAFNGTGIGNGDAAYPYESVYTSQDRLIMQEARDQVVEIFTKKGLVKSSASDLPEDHIALELEFMAYLCSEAQGFFTAKDRPSLAACILEQQEFLQQHLLNWVPAFCADVEKRAKTDFYKAVAKITIGFLRLEEAIVRDLVDETVIAKA